MSRPRNDELKEHIEHAAWALFSSRGYDATSYSAIASACNISRNLVQYHFPKKETLAIDFMERILQEAQTALGIGPDDLHDNFSNIYTVGTCYFEFLLQDNGYRSFLLDIVKSRDLTESVLSFNTSWALARVDVPANVMDNGAVLRGVIVHMGGFYELLYHCLKCNESFDPHTELFDVMETFMTSLGYAKTRSREILQMPSPGAKGMARAVKKMNYSLPI